MKTNTHAVRSGCLWRASALVLAALCFHATPGCGAVQDLVGRYVGAWTNTTFGSTGKAVIEIEVNGTNAALTFKMDGYVFGVGNAPPITMPGTVSNNLILIDNQGVGLFGDIKGTVDSVQKTLTATLTNIPGGFIQSVTNAGTIDGGVIRINYTVQFPRPPDAQNPAHGVMVATLTPPIAISSVRRDGTHLLLTWTGGQEPFQVQTLTNLASGAWQDVGLQTSFPTSNIPIGVTGGAYFRVGGQ